MAQITREMQEERAHRDWLEQRAREVQFLVCEDVISQS